MNYTVTLKTAISVRDKNNATVERSILYFLDITEVYIGSDFTVFHKSGKLKYLPAWVLKNDNILSILKDAE